MCSVLYSDIKLCDNLALLVVDDGDSRLPPGISSTYDHLMYWINPTDKAFKQPNIGLLRATYLKEMIEGRGPTK